MGNPQQTTALTTQTSPLITELAGDWKITPATMIDTLKKTIFKEDVSNAVMVAFLQVCNTYKLNPFVKEIYAFPAKGGGGFVPMVPIDGWTNIINRNPNFDGLEFVDVWHGSGNQKTLESTTCIIYRKDRGHPIKVTEYMQECYQENKEPWKKWPARMLRHKALIQCARIAFSLAGIYDPDEAERIADATPENGKSEIKRPTTIDAQTTTTSGPAAVQGNEAGAETAASTAVTESAQRDAKPDSSAPAEKCMCTCCKNANCDCLSKDEVDQCGCKNCQTYMKLMRENPETNAEKEEPAAEQKAAPSGKPEGPYVPQDKLRKLFAVAASKGWVPNDDHTDELHILLKSKWGIESLKEIPVKMLDEILTAINPDLKLKNKK